MTTNQHSEAHYENTLIQLFQDMGYAYECGYDECTPEPTPLCYVIPSFRS